MLTGGRGVGLAPLICNPTAHALTHPHTRTHPCRWFCFLTTARWIGFRLDILVALLMSVAPLLMMAVHSSVSPGSAALPPPSPGV